MVQSVCSVSNPSSPSPCNEVLWVAVPNVIKSARWNGKGDSVLSCTNCQCPCFLLFPLLRNLFILSLWLFKDIIHFTHHTNFRKTVHIPETFFRYFNSIDTRSRVVPLNVRNMIFKKYSVLRLFVSPDSVNGFSVFGRNAGFKFRGDLSCCFHSCQSGHAIPRAFYGL